jgi:hypothetical protein
MVIFYKLHKGFSYRESIKNYFIIQFYHLSFACSRLFDGSQCCPKYCLTFTTLQTMVPMLPFQSLHTDKAILFCLCSLVMPPSFLFPCSAHVVPLSTIVLFPFLFSFRMCPVSHSSSLQRPA